MNHSFIKSISKSVYFSLIIISIGINHATFCQVVAEKTKQKPNIELDEPIFMVVEVQPEFPGGSDAKKSFFSKNLRTPKFKPAVKGSVIISFVVNADGSLQDVTVIKSLHPEYDQEAVKLVNLMPKWIPGRQSGRTLRVRYIQPVEFR